MVKANVKITLRAISWAQKECPLQNWPVRVLQCLRPSWEHFFGLSITSLLTFPFKREVLVEGSPMVLPAL